MVTAADKLKCGYLNTTLKCISPSLLVIMCNSHFLDPFKRPAPAASLPSAQIDVTPMINNIAEEGIEIKTGPRCQQRVVPIVWNCA